MWHEDLGGRSQVLLVRKVEDLPWWADSIGYSLCLRRGLARVTWLCFERTIEFLGYALGSPRSDGIVACPEAITSSSTKDWD